MSAPGVRRWLRRNRVGLVATALLLPAALLASLSVSWFDYQGRQGVDAVEVDRGETGEYLGASFRLLALESYAAGTPEGERYGVAEGTELVVARLEVRPGPAPAEGEPTRCTVDAVEPRPGGDRVWIAKWDSETDYPEDRDAEMSCALDGEPYVLEQFFLVAPGAGSKVLVQISAFGELPRVLRLR